MTIGIFRFVYIVVLGIIILLGVACFFIHNHDIDFSPLQQGFHGKASILLDDNGVEWGRFQFDKREYIVLENMPEHLIQAFLAVEDRKFFHHPGISFRGIIRSTLINLYRRKRVQGASTITQQLVRMLFFDAKKTYSRKIKEQIYSILVEMRFSKEQILETYLNNVYFGYGIYGVQAAAQRFWGIDISQISVNQAAVLACIMRSPKHYNPIHALDAVLKRKNIVLKMMFDLNYISFDEYQKAVNESIIIQSVDLNVIAAHLKETIRIILEDLMGKKQLYSGGLIIQTTINIEVQQKAEQAFSSHILALKQSLHEQIDGALVSIEPTSGEIKALIGGFNFKESKFNRAIQAKKQLGSVFKAFVYSAALEKGLQFDDVEIDEPFSLVQKNSVWRPENYSKEFYGPMTRAYALSHSNNIVTIKTLLNIGVESVVDIAKRCHFSSNLLPYPSLALGCIDVTLMEAVGAFNIFANNGKYVSPHFLKWVKNERGEKIYKASIDKDQVIDSKIAGSVHRVLSFGIERLKSLMGASWLGGQAIGKTGTTNDSRTCWFCGSTPDLTTAIYVGCDQNQSLGKKVYGSKTAFPIWFDLHKKIEKKKTNFYLDPRLTEKLVNWKTGKIAFNKNDKDIVALLV